MGIIPSRVMVDSSMPDSHVLIFDNDCRMCSTLARLLSRVDVFHRVDWIPYQSLESPPPGLDWENLERAAYLVHASNGSHHEGFYAIRMLTVRIALLAPFAPLFWFPGMNVIGVAVYRWVAKNRHRIFACQGPHRTGSATASSSLKDGDNLNR